jgi:hypothetical protein
MKIKREGQLLLNSRAAAPTASLGNGDVWYNSSADKAELRARATNQYVLTSQVAELDGHFSWANNAPKWTVTATNNSSGLRIDVLGGDPSSGTIRFLTNGATFVTIFGDGRIGLRNDMTADSSFLSDGQIWYRSDTDHFKSRANGVTYEQLSALTGSATWDIGSLGTLANSSTTIAVTGAVVGDTVTVSPSMPSAGVVVSADVTSADTVTLRSHNTTAGTIDPASATFRVKVIKQ